MIIIIIYILINIHNFIVIKQYSKQNKGSKIKKEPHKGSFLFMNAILQIT
jgi:uncharacterized MAPEG superfamily protein